jgi:hypothetical protein
MSTSVGVKYIRRPHEKQEIHESSPHEHQRCHTVTALIRYYAVDHAGGVVAIRTVMNTL